MSEQELINVTEEFVKAKLTKVERGHDWWHAHRVRNNALRIYNSEGGDYLTIHLAALVHDLIDDKLFIPNEAEKELRQFFVSCDVDNAVIESVFDIIKNISFSNGISQSEVPELKEFKIVQDADRLDAIGAIGIARAFNYGGANGRILYDPNVAYVQHVSKASYRNAKSHTINHFYEKLFLLKDHMNTETGKMMANDRHHFMKEYVHQFYQEWGDDIIDIE